MNIVSIPRWIRAFYSSALWRINTKEKEIYLTFDDGPTPIITEFVLDELKKYKAKATFFCIGEQVEKNTELYRRILSEGHEVGNHTYRHLSGWKTANNVYFKDVEQASKVIKSKLFRPPYGRIKISQYRGLKQDYKIVFWDIIPGDFVKGISSKKVEHNVLKNIKNGSIIVLHDSEKCAGIVKEVLPNILKELTDRGYVFRAIET